METKLEQILTSCHKDAMIVYLNSHPKGFEEAIKLAVADKQPYSWRAAWLLWSCMKENDIRIRKHVRKIVSILPSRGDNQQRELMKILQLMELKESYEGALFDHCVSVWESIDKQPSVRMNAFKIIIKILYKHPDLSKEIISLTQEHYMETLSPGVRKSVRLMLSGIDLN